MWTAEKIMEEMEERVRDGEPISPASWIESASRVNILSGELDNKIANYEAELATIEAEYLKQDMTSARAKALAKAEIDYKDYLALKGRLKRTQEWIMLAKKRAIIPDL